MKDDLGDHMHTHLRVFCSTFLFILIFCSQALAQDNLPSEGVYPGRCGERIGRKAPGETYSIFTCGSMIDGFAVKNEGPNRIVPARADELDSFPARDFYFNFPGRHRQEMHLLMADWPSEYGPDVRISKFYFFPRLVVPSIQKLGSGQYEVTLPNLDRVLFDSATHEVRGGAFDETPLDIPAYLADPRLFAGITYRSKLPGASVLVRIDRRGPASFHAGYASVTKQCGGVVCGICQVATKEILRDSTSEFRFPDDAQFNAYLEDKCGFGFLSN